MMELYFPVCLCNLCTMPEDEVVANDKIRKEIQRLDAELQRASEDMEISAKLDCLVSLHHSRRQKGEEIMQLANKKPQATKVQIN